MNKTEGFFIAKNKLQTGEMVGVKSIFSRKDLEALTKEELIFLSAILINKFNNFI